MQRSIPEQGVMKTGITITGIIQQPTQTGECMQEVKPTTTITLGAGVGVILGAGAAGTEAIIRIGATAVAGASDFHGEAHGVGAPAGIWAGDTHLIGAIILIGDGEAIIHIGATVATGEVITMLLITEEAVLTEEDLILITEVLPINTELPVQTVSEEVLPVPEVSETMQIMEALEDLITAVVSDKEILPMVVSEIKTG